MKLTTTQEVLTLLKGATFLASGGGGPYFLAKNIVEEYLGNQNTFEIDLIDSSNLKDDEWTCIAAGMAEPSKASGLSPWEIVEPTISAVENMEELISNVISIQNDKFKDFKKFDCLTPVEVGAINVTIPLITAFKKSLPVVNGDPSGRSVPTLELTTFATTQPVMPNMASSVDKNNFTVLSLNSYEDLNTAYAKLIGAGLIGMDTGLCLSPMQGKDIKQGSLVKGTLNDAFNIGKIFEEDTTSIEKIKKIKSTLENSQSPRKVKHICTGEVVDFSIQSVNDNDLGYIKIKVDNKKIFTILIQNENIIGQFSDETEVYITGPDSICYLSIKDGALNNVEDIIDNVQIQIKFEKGEKQFLHILGIEASNTILDNQKLMSNWKNAFQTSNYFGEYTSKLWK